ncbi:MAG: cache domain-containing protein [Tenericutes bacterium]|nr:cache domain-containing protein [Mycoplasmatota bacterium]
MDRQTTILKRNKLMNRLIIVLGIVMISMVLFREIRTYRQSLSYFNEQIYERAKGDIKQEVEARIDEVNGVKAEIESELYLDILTKVRDMNNLASDVVDRLPLTATLEEKRAEYVDVLYQFNIYKQDYKFFSISSAGISYLSELVKSMEGTNILDKQDEVTGAYIFVEMIDAVTNSETNDAYYSYYWIKEVGGEHIKKISYLYYNEDLDLILGLGIYEQDYIQEVQEELINRFNTYSYTEEDYIYIIGFDGEIVYYPDEIFSSEDLMIIETTSGESFHQTILDTLAEEDSIYINYYFEYKDINTYKTAYVAEIVGWDMYLGQSFIDDSLEIAQEEYIASILPEFIVFNILIILTTLAVITVIKVIFSRNIDDVIEEFNDKNSKIKEMSFIDFLTGLNNRTYFDEVVQQITPCKKDVAVVMVDANGLKLINDAYGHAVGDLVLVELAKLLKMVYREGTVFRWGGDEFLVVLENTTENKLKEQEALFFSLSKERFINKVQLSASSGYYISEVCNEEVYNMINHAEKRMYDRKLFESLSIKRTIIDSLLKTLYDSYNFEKHHSQNVMKYSLLIGKALGIEAEELNKLKLAAQLHDIGKISIPDYILSKVEPLTDEEFFEIKLHPEKGYRILSAYPDLSEYAKFVLYHHERWDGFGYPHGIKGDKIPLYSRIIAVADAFDAMTEERVYKKAKTEAEAIEEVMRCSGTQFDPKIADVFVKAFKESKSK